MAKGTTNKKGSKTGLLLLIGAFLLFGGAKASGMIAPVRGRISSKFGEEREGSKHNGIDISVPVGTPIKAPSAGIVTKVYKTEDGGNQILIRHKNGYTSGYAHLKSSIVKEGKTLSKGELFAYSGNTGKHSTGPHLHFTLRDPKGRYVDPAKLLRWG